MHYKTIIYDKRDTVCFITLNRPKARNAINRQMAEELSDICQTFCQDQEIRLVVITGAGNKAFSCGTDPEELGSRDKQSLAIASTVERITCPVIAAINGDAIGQGLELALGCDIRIAVDTARFGLPQIIAGYIPCDGATQLLPRIVGRTKAMEMILTGETIDAREACEIGLINKIVSLPELMPLVTTMSQTIAAQSPLAMKHAKEAVLKGLDMTLEQGLRLEADLYFLLHTTSDRIEGIKAFLEKRQPDFKGK